MRSEARTHNQPASLTTFSRYLRIPCEHFSYNRWLDYHEPRVPQNSLTSFPKNKPTEGSRKTFDFPLRSLHLTVGKMDFPSSHSVFQSQTTYHSKRHNAAETGSPHTKLCPFSARVRFCCHLSLEVSTAISLHSWQCNVGKSKQGPGLPSNFLNSTTLPLFTLASASQMPSTSEILEGPRGQKSP